MTINSLLRNEVESSKRISSALREKNLFYSYFFTMRYKQTKIIPSDSDIYESDDEDVNTWRSSFRSRSRSCSRSCSRPRPRPIPRSRSRSCSRPRPRPIPRSRSRSSSCSRSRSCSRSCSRPRSRSCSRSCSRPRSHFCSPCPTNPSYKRHVYRDIDEYDDRYTLDDIQDDYRRDHRNSHFDGDPIPPRYTRRYTHTNKIFGSVDIRESSTSLEIYVNLPGVMEQDIAVNIYISTVVITVEQHEPVFSDRLYAIQSYSGRFNGNYQLPIRIPSNVKASHMSYSYSDGLLKVHIPKYYYRS